MSSSAVLLLCGYAAAGIAAVNVHFGTYDGAVFAGLNSISCFLLASRPVPANGADKEKAA